MVGWGGIFSILAGGKINERDIPKIEIIKNAFEESWNHSEEIDVASIPTVENLKDAVEEICEENNIKRIVLFIDEAYSLSKGGEGSNDYGAEAIEVLIKAMESE